MVEVEMRDDDVAHVGATEAQALDLPGRGLGFVKSGVQQRPGRADPAVVRAVGQPVAGVDQHQSDVGFAEQDVTDQPPDERWCHRAAVEVVHPHAVQPPTPSLGAGTGFASAQAGRATCREAVCADGPADKLTLGRCTTSGVDSCVMLNLVKKIAIRVQARRRRIAVTPPACSPRDRDPLGSACLHYALPMTDPFNDALLVCVRGHTTAG